MKHTEHKVSAEILRPSESIMRLYEVIMELKGQRNPPNLERSVRNVV